MAANPSLQIVQADFESPEHQQALLFTTDAYSRDPHGQNAPMSDETAAALVPMLKDHPAAIAFLAFIDGKPVGSAICALSFSTFKAKPILNIHDLVVIPGHRGFGIGNSLVEAVKSHAKQLGCCFVSLEVAEDNEARSLYKRLGFKGTDKDDGPRTFFCRAPVE
jgi:ribosomal protein S18 acetylase RimI-like enzyme